MSPTALTPVASVLILAAVVAAVAVVAYLVRDASCPKCGYHQIRRRKETLSDGMSVRTTFTCDHCHHTWSRG